MRDTRAVVLLAALPPDHASLVAALQRWGSGGAAVRLAGSFELPPSAAVGLMQTYALARVAEGQGPRFRRQLVGADQAERLRLLVLAHPGLRRRLAAGDRFVGLDQPSRSTADALNGTRLPPSWRVSARALRSGGLRRLLFEQARDGALLLARRRGDGTSAGLAGRLIDLAAWLADSDRRRADALGDFTAAELGVGVQPSRLGSTVAAELTVADADLARGRTGRAAQSYHEALQVLYHRGVQFDRLDSPLPADPGAFLAPLTGSTTARRVGAPAGRSQAAHVGRPRSILLATYANPNFVGPVAARLQQVAPDVSVHSQDFATHPAIRRLGADRTALIRLRLGSAPELSDALEAALRPHLEQADVVFVDWCTAFAVLLTAVDPGRSRIIVRLHSFEALSYWPQLVDFSRVDDVVFVSAHLRDLAVDAIPGLAASTARRHVVPIGIDTARFRRPKDPGARFTLGLVGYGQIAKDPRWALDVLNRLRASDPRYRLVLIGADLTVGGSAAGRDYVRRLRTELDPLEAIGAVQRLGQTDDVAGALQQVGIILSSSVREGYHLGLIEGAAGGAVPVVRDWPLFASRVTGARSLYPEPWVVSDVAAAVERIRAVTASEESWRRHGREAAELVGRRFDTARTDPLLDTLFFGDQQ